MKFSYEDLHIRWMIRRDCPRVLDIDRSCFAFYLTNQTLVEFLRQRNVIGLVCESYGDDTDIVAFVLYELQKTSLEILRFAVDPDYQRLGYGTAIVKKLQNKVNISPRRENITYEADERNLPSHLFLRSLGFKAEVVKGSIGHPDTYLFKYQKDKQLA